MFKKIIFCLTIVAVLASTLFLSVGASSVYNKNSVRYINYHAPLKEIIVENPTDYYLNDSIANAIQIKSMGADMPISAEYIGRLYKLQQFAHLNYPYQVSEPYNNTGRLASFTNNISQLENAVGITPPGTYVNVMETPSDFYDYTNTIPSDAVNRCLLSGRSITFSFEDFVSSSNNPGYFSFSFWKLNNDTPNIKVVLEYDYQYLAMDGTFKTVHKETRDQIFYYEENPGSVYHCDVRTDLKFPTPTDAKIDKFIISNFKIRVSNIIGPQQRLSQVFISSSCDVSQTDNPASNEVYEYLQNNVENTTIIRGLGDYSFTEWLETAVGGFLDFEFVQGVSLGGVILVMLGVGILMLLIRIFKG